MTEVNEKELVDLRHSKGLYSVKELCVMFCCGRGSIDYALNSKRLNYISPNNRDRYVYISDFVEYMESLKK